MCVTNQHDDKKTNHLNLLMCAKKRELSFVLRFSFGLPRYCSGVGVERQLPICREQSHEVLPFAPRRNVLLATHTHEKQMLSPQETEADKFDRAKLVEVLTAPYIEDSGDGIVALDPHALKKLFTTSIGLLRVSSRCCFFAAS